MYYVVARRRLYVDEFKKIMYADPSENDVSGVLFYSTTDNLSTSMGAQISYAILGSDATLIQPSATGTSDASGNTGTDDSHKARYMTPGIPLPNYGKTTKEAVASNDTTQKYYTSALVDAGGSSFGRIMIRLLATHLMGHPFAQSFIANESSIISDISNTNITSQLSTRLLKNDITMFADGFTMDGSNKVPNNIATATADGTRYKAQKSAGIRNQILQSIYEALLGTAPERFDLSGNDAGADVSGADVSGGTDFDYGNLDPSQCRPRTLPFRANDSISFYFRPRVRLGIDESVGGSGAEYGNDDLSGVGQGAAGTATTSTITNMFFNPRHRWIAHSDAAHVTHGAATTPAAAFDAGNHIDTYADTGQTNLPAITMTGTDLVLGKSSGEAGYAGEVGTGTVFDGHCWKVKVIMT